ncbi:MAG: hypothetical protein DRZ76_03520 [Candidatus Nealsonbacteria bacterium]|nr:MAG: hypothetical protein DRZ76_03520 [Candidatus Nealsonbacteria bacterium]
MRSRWAALAQQTGCVRTAGNAVVKNPRGQFHTSEGGSAAEGIFHTRVLNFIGAMKYSVVRATAV